MPARARGLIVGILLAAGAGSRFGGGKLIARLADGRGVAETACARLLPAVDRVVAVVPAQPGALEDALRAAGAEVVRCDTAAPGRGVSIAYGVSARADDRTMTKPTPAKLVVGEPTPFVTNHLTIVVVPGNPHGVASLADLANPDLKVVVCAPQVPCGGATQQVAELAGVTLTPVSEENSVSSVLTKVTAGEADAGLVYRTDAKGAGDKVSVVDFPEADQVTNVYQIALLADAQNPEAAQAFIDLVASSEGQQVMREAGFNTPQG